MWVAAASSRLSLNPFSNITVGNKTVKTKLVHYSADTQTGTLGRKLSNHSVFSEKKILKFFCRRTNMQPLKTLKPFKLTWPLRKQPLNWWMLLHGPYAKKKNENLVVTKRCNWTIFFQMSGFECPDCKFEQHTDLQLFLPMQGLVCCETV